jgi:hypothetical protein
VTKKRRLDQARKQGTPLVLLARKIGIEIDRLFARDIEILGEPGRFLVAAFKRGANWRSMICGSTGLLRRRWYA